MHVLTRWYFQTQPFTARTLAGGASGTLLAVRVRSEQRGGTAHAQLVLRTEGAEYRAPLLLYSGKLQLVSALLAATLLIIGHREHLLQSPRLASMFLS